MPRILALLLTFVTAQVWALGEEPAPALIPIPEQPDLPPPTESGQPMEPDITIIRRDKELIEEYRVNNRLYMVKIKPSVGPPYYLLDTDGDGKMDLRRNELEKGMQVPQWVLFSW
ncbi:MAG: DUF2782 domain-containing protein [Methylococcaceae bacterium]|nr:DUF2782 domain-containing protein [Methylococcaceae bacterium]